VLHVRLERAADRNAPLDLGAGVSEHDLDACEGSRDVKDVHVADVADSENLIRQLALSGCDRDPEALAQLCYELRRVDSVRRLDRGDDGGSVPVRREELEAHRLHSLPARPPQPGVMIERGLEAFREQQS
jgi:hypothetical protein